MSESNGIDYKVCSMCNQNKPKSDYHKLTTKICGVQAKCKECTSIYKKQRYWENHDTELAKMTASRLKPENIIQRKGYYSENKDEYKKRYLKYMEDSEKKEKKNIDSRERYMANREEINKRHKENSQKPEVKERLRQKHHIRKQTDIVYVIKRRLRFRLRHIIKALGSSKYKRMSSIELLGCDMEFFKKYIQGKFTDGMCWERLSEIHIDHIKPCSKFDLTKMTEQKLCFHYTNLQPLWEIDNLRKNNIYPYKISS